MKEEAIFFYLLFIFLFFIFYGLDCFVYFIIFFLDDSFLQKKELERRERRERRGSLIFLNLN